MIRQLGHIELFDKSKNKIDYRAWFDSTPLISKTMLQTRIYNRTYKSDRFQNGMHDYLYTFYLRRFTGRELVDKDWKIVWVNDRNEDQEALEQPVLVQVEVTDNFMDLIRTLPEQTMKGPPGPITWTRPGERPMVKRVAKHQEKKKAKEARQKMNKHLAKSCLLYTSPSPRDKRQSRMPSSA